MTLKIGSKINRRYIIEEFKGNGAFGEVWKAYDSLLAETVALKLFGDMNDDGIETFKAEFITMRGVMSPYLVNATHIDLWGKRPFLVMKYCENGSSSKLCGNCSESTLWKFIHDVASGLEYLHSQPDSIIHQDIKPENVLIDDDLNFLISDFGISKKLRTTIQKMSIRAIGVGSIAYMGPERFGEDPLPIKASDIWSLGASIYELATGNLPFNGMGGGMQSYGASLPLLGSEWSKDLNELMRRCLSKEPWNRPTATEIVRISKTKIQSIPIDVFNDKGIEKERNISKETKPEPIQRRNKDVNEDSDFVDLGLSVLWSRKFEGTGTEFQLGDGMTINNIRSQYPDLLNSSIPAKEHYEELFTLCTWAPRKIGRVCVGYEVTGKNGNSIYLPFVPVQNKEDKVSKSEWRKMPKEIYILTREEYNSPRTSLKVKVSADDIRFTTISMDYPLHIRLIKE